MGLGTSIVEVLAPTRSTGDVTIASATGGTKVSIAHAM
jgi:hypothetical protein